VAADVTTGQRIGNGRGLDGKWIGDSESFKSMGNGRANTEI
jgi:hypothetical protein